MKTNQYVKELNTKTIDQLNEELVNAKKELFKLIFNNPTNLLEKTSRFKYVLMNIARIQTVITGKKANATE